MVNGLMSQLTTRVSASPLGFLPTSLRHDGSTLSIIG